MYNTDENYNYLHATPSSRHNTFNSRISTTRTIIFETITESSCSSKILHFRHTIWLLFIKNSNTQETPPLLVIKILETLLVIIRIFGTNIGSLPQLRNRTVFHPITSRSYMKTRQTSKFLGSIKILGHQKSSRQYSTVHFVFLTRYIPKMRCAPSHTIDSQSNRILVLVQQTLTIGQNFAKHTTYYRTVGTVHTSKGETYFRPENYCNGFYSSLFFLRGHSQVL